MSVSNFLFKVNFKVKVNSVVGDGTATVQVLPLRLWQTPFFPLASNEVGHEVRRLLPYGLR